MPQMSIPQIVPYVRTAELAAITRICTVTIISLKSMGEKVKISHAV